MFAAPASAAGWAGLIVLWTMVAFFARWLTRTAIAEHRRRHHVDLVKILEAPLPKPAPRTIRFTRDDPSPRPRKTLHR